MLGKINITFKTPAAHLDSIKISAAFIFACAAILERREFEEICEKVREGKIRFSSVFPSGYLPKPAVPLSPEKLEGEIEINGKKVNMKKEYKKFKFVPQKAVEKLLENEEDGYLKEIEELIKRDEKERVIEEVRVRNSLRMREATKLFHLHFHKITDACIYFSCDHEDKKIIESSFRFLENTGLGQKISSGLGEFKLISIEPEKVKEYPKKLLLSKCLVTDENFQGFVQVGEINLRLRNGKILPRIPVFVEGSVFEKCPKGGCVEKENYLTSCYGIYYGGGE